MPEQPYSTITAPVVFENAGRAFASSRDVAAYFGKPHKNVLRAIRGLIAAHPELRRLNFAPSEWVNEQAKPQPVYDMDRDGFVLIAMGFTGMKALEFKILYIDAFNKMEAALRDKGTFVAGGALTSTTEAAKLALVREGRLTFGPRTAQKLWIDVGLPVVPEMFSPPRQIDFWTPPTAGPAQ